MGEVTKYPNGTFCWIDLATTDVAGAKAFYRELFGWDTEDVPVGDGGTFTLYLQMVAGLSPLTTHVGGRDGAW